VSERRTYEPRTFELRVMTPDEIEQLPKELLEFERLEAVSDPMRHRGAVAGDRTSCPRRKIKRRLVEQNSVRAPIIWPHRALSCENPAWAAGSRNIEA
jgi:hypothetical protein